jgi:hypothetical protein
MEAWHSALTEAERLNRIEELVAVARGQYPTNARLAEASDLYLLTRRQGTAQTEGRLPDVGADTATPEPDRGTILTTFAAASATLLNWPTTLDDGRWIERPELRQMSASLGAGRGATRTLLLGPPGSGKSALLARCGQSASDHGAAAVLAIKADRLPAAVNSRSELASYLRLPADADTCVRIIARDQPVLLLLDQLDALAELLDLRSERLNVLLELMESLRDVENVHVVASCRTFDRQYDTCLSAVAATEVHLQLPSWEQVAQVLAEHKIDASGWPVEFRELLRTPQHLRVFLRRLRDGQEARVFDSYQQMLDDLWARHVTGKDGPQGRSALLDKMATQMADEEELSLPLVRFEDESEQVSYLVSHGILCRPENGPRMEFQHQTLFEHALARRFARRSGGLADFALQRQDAMFLRPRIWATLRYLRAANRATYLREIELLWGADLRRHLRRLLVDFLGQVPDPQPLEQTWFSGALGNDDLRNTALAAVRGNVGWFRFLAEAHLPGLMRLPADQSWPIALLLGASWPFGRDDCLRLLRQHWIDDPSWDYASWRVLEQLTVWDEVAVSLVCRILRRTPVHSAHVNALTRSVADSAPGLASRVVSSYLEAQLERFEAAPEPVAPDLPEDATETERLTHGLFHPGKQYDTLLEDRQGDWFELAAVARVCPGEFVRRLWPWFSRVVAHIVMELPEDLRGYRQSYALATRLFPIRPVLEGVVEEDLDEYHRYPLVASIDVALRVWAQAEPAEFLAFAGEAGSQDAAVVQRMLCRAVTAIAQTHPTGCLGFLLSDPRRLSLGDHDDGVADSVCLVACLVPALSAKQAMTLEAAILRWSAYAPGYGGVEPGLRRHRLLSDRRTRLRLLSAFPAGCLTKGTAAMVDSERQSLLEEEAEIEWPDDGFIGSPMSAEQMARARPEHILNLFRELPDDTQDTHPRHGLRGGSVQAASEFASLARQDPRKAISLFPQFNPGQQERPVGYALVSIAETTEVPTAELIRLILELDQRGFQSAEFRIQAARALEHRLRKGQDHGLPEEICRVMEGWLLSPWGQTQSDPVTPKGDDGSHDSILFGRQAAIGLPSGPYHVLHTLTYGLLMRRPAAAGRWLDLLEEYLAQSETVDGWPFVSLFDLQYLGLADRGRAIRFLEELFAKLPSVQDSFAGARAISYAMWFTPEDVRLRWLEALRVSAWAQGPQVYGELLGQWLIQHPSAAAPKQLESALGPSMPHRDLVTLGLATAAVQTWNKPDERERAMQLLLRLLPTAAGQTAETIILLFLRPEQVSINPVIHAVLEGVVNNPALLDTEHVGYLIERFDCLLPAERELVYRICVLLVERRSQSLVSIQEHLGAYAGNLLGIAMTLQRYGGDFRQRGVDLFERLLDIDVPGVQRLLNDLDKRPTAKALPAPRARRRRSPPRRSA